MTADDPKQPAPGQRLPDVDGDYRINEKTRLAYVPWVRIGAESAAIVASILIAFAIDAWWADRSERIARDKLVAAMIVEFEDTISEADSTLTKLDDHIQRLESYGRLILEGDDVTPSDLRPLLIPAFRGVSFRRSTSTYDSALSSGAIGLIDSREFTTAMSQFTEALEDYKLYEELWIQNIHLGRHMELQNKYGDLRVLIADPDTFASIYKLDEPDLRAAYSDKLVYAQSHTALGSKQAKRARLREISDSLQEAIDALKSLD